MNTERLASLAAAMVVGGGSLLAASGANALAGVNGMSLNGIGMNGIGMNGVTDNAVASQGFDFNNVSAQGVSFTAPCPLPLDRGKAVIYHIGTSP